MATPPPSISNVIFLSDTVIKIVWSLNVHPKVRERVNSVRVRILYIESGDYSERDYNVTLGSSSNDIYETQVDNLRFGESITINLATIVN